MSAGKLRNIMSSSSSSASNSRLIEGVFAITKPPSVTSADVVRDLQTAFRPSALFKPLLDSEIAKRTHESSFQRKRRREKNIRLKIGHGGTLDPLATGVLIIGVGRGTKHLQGFLDCTKSYSTTVLFGAETDTYDIQGKVLRKAPFAHVTRQKVEEALAGFRGEIKQLPPIYSALSMNGKRLYEYAREGKELPKEIQPRHVRVQEMRVTEWLERHEFRWPEAEAPAEEREAAEKVLALEAEREGTESRDAGKTFAGVKRDREDEDENAVSGSQPPAKRQHGESTDGGEAPPTLADVPEQSTGPDVAAEKSSADDKPSEVTRDDGIPPAVKIDMTVTSGFYVRSLAHDLGKAVESHGLMATLVRTRQGDYSLGDNVLDHSDLAQGEEVWGPKVRSMLEKWLDVHPEGSSNPRIQMSRKNSSSERE